MLSKIFGKSGQKVRTKAERFGISVTDTTHNAYVSSRGGKGQYEPVACKKYSIARAGSANVAWSLDQVFEDQSSNPLFFKCEGGKGGYLLTISTPVTDAMKQTFTEIAKEYSEEYFAFESKDSEVSIYWEEWGGEQMANRLYQTLNKLRNL